MAMQPTTSTLVEKVPAATMIFKARLMAVAEPAVEPGTQSDQEAPLITASLP